MVTSRDPAHPLGTVITPGNTFTRRYRHWNFQHATAIIVLVTIAEMVDYPYPMIAALTVWMVFSMIRLAWLKRISTSGSHWANALTATRAVAAVVLLAAISATLAGRAVESSSAEFTFLLSRPGRWWIVGILLLVESTDFFDGRVARKGSIGSFGPIWDMETDAVFALALTLFNRHLLSAGPQVLVIGLMRYFYVLVWREERTHIQPPPIQVFFAKTTTAVLVVAMILVIAPPVGSVLREITLFIVLAMQIVSFGWDMFVQRRIIPETH